MILLLALLAAASPARARHLRPEEDPRFGGSAKVFAKARVAFDAPKDKAQLAPGDVEVRLRISGYELAGGAHAHLIVDNLPALQVDDASAPLVVRGVEPGPHLLRVVLCRPWHEVVKARHAFAMVRFWSGPRPGPREAVPEERAIWPDPRRPLLTYVLPIGEPHKDDAAVELIRRDSEAPARKPAAQTAVSIAPVSIGEDYGSFVPAKDPPPPPPPSVPAPPPQPSPPVRNAIPHRVALDFYLSNLHLGRGRRGSKVRVVLDKKELQLVVGWRPKPLGKLRAGGHHVTIDLLDRMALKVPGPLNRTDRRFLVR